MSDPRDWRDRHVARAEADRLAAKTPGPDLAEWLTALDQLDHADALALLDELNLACAIDDDTGERVAWRLATSAAVEGDERRAETFLRIHELHARRRLARELADHIEAWMLDQ